MSPGSSAAFAPVLVENASGSSPFPARSAKLGGGEDSSPFEK